MIIFSELQKVIWENYALSLMQGKAFLEGIGLPNISINRASDILRFKVRGQNNALYMKAWDEGIYNIDVPTMVVNEGGIYKREADFLVSAAGFINGRWGSSGYELKETPLGFEILYAKDDDLKVWPRTWKVSSVVSFREMKEVLDRVSQNMIDLGEKFLTKLRQERDGKKAAKAHDIHFKAA